MTVQVLVAGFYLQHWLHRISSGSLTALTAPKHSYMTKVELASHFKTWSAQSANQSALLDMV